MARRISFYDEIRRNKIQSFFLISLVLFVLLALFYIVGFFYGGDYFFFIIFFGTIFSIVYVLGSYYKSAEIAVASARAKPASVKEYRQFHDSIGGLCLASGLPKPKLYVMNSSSINAFASGRDPKHAVICVTTGALEKLTKHELEGVLAHELSHVANYDIRFMTLTAVLVGMVSIISQLFLRSLFWSSVAGGGDNRDRNNMILMLIGILFAVIAPLVVVLVQLAISRKREYGADSSAVKFTRSPTGLIGALKKIRGNKPMEVSGAVAPLFLAKPGKKKEWFATHPPLEERIAKLERM